MNNDDDALSSVYKKIEREKALINAANAMRQQTNNEAVKSKLDTQMREGRRNIQFFEEKMRELQMRKMDRSMRDMSLGAGSAQQGLPPSGFRSDADGPPTPPPKDARGNYIQQGSNEGGYGSQDYSQIGGHGNMMPPRHPYAPPAPGSNNALSRPRPQFTKLGMLFPECVSDFADRIPDLIKYDTPYLGPRIQLMLSQLEFKLNVEKQYLKGIEKMVQLYQMEGDKKSRADAAGRREESVQKIQLLQRALKRYEDLHIDMDSNDAPDGMISSVYNQGSANKTISDDSINTPNMRKPLTGQLSIRVMAVKDVDHSPTSRFSRGSETFVAVKVEDNVVARTKISRTDRWDGETHNVDVDKANEIELTVYDKPGDHALPIGLLWIRISDVVEEMRKKKIEAEISSSGWVSADRMGSGIASPSYNPPQTQFPGPPSPGQNNPNFMNNAMGPPATSIPPQPIDAWFALEPTGQIQLSLSFIKHTANKRPFDLALNRKGAIRQRKEAVHEMYGHKFVSQQFYNIMRCALCGDFLKYSAGMQCEECKYTCHTKCYPSVVTKCISISNAETDPDEEKINHRIPHRFEKFSNIGANWCCHCGYMLPLGKKNARRCTGKFERHLFICKL
jgi:ferritin-like metal-binding protein YciE